jgi:adenine phosphoribosyltransferase|tara:strand:- start:499 stop:996 length:498 start_codon:yes stop_codon:yes gene_type:complete
MGGYKELIKEVPNFPIKGVNFKDISPLLADREIFRSAIADMGRLVQNPDYWIGIDARGFIFASALSMVFGGGVVMCRKKGKLPPPVESASYSLEYDTATLQIKQGSGSAVIVDDVLATGGTLRAVNYLAQKAGYDVKDNLVLIDLQYVPTIVDIDFKVKSLVQYE